MFCRSSLTALLAISVLTSTGRSQTKPSSTISLQERTYIATRVYSTIQGYFNGWQDTNSADIDKSYRNFDQGYQDYLRNISGSDDRRDFDLETMRLVALLHNGHTWFDDRWLQENYGWPLGFYAKPVQGQWIVTRSDVAGLAVGEGIAEIDGKPMEEFFQDTRKYLSDSNERSEQEDLFASSYLFPRQFVVSLSDYRKVKIVRSQSAALSPPREEVGGRWLEPALYAYLRIPSFSGVTSESEALALVRQFKNARGLIIDLRGNPGGYGNPPLELQAALMDRPFRRWRESLGRFSFPGGNHAELVSGNDWARPEQGMDSGIYTGWLVLLVDHGCASYCEDFVMPFKDNHRATLVGETTAGTYAQTYYTDFANGMRLNTAASHEIFPDGSPFEGVGISPDIEAIPTLDDIRSGKDVVLNRAIRVLKTPPPALVPDRVLGHND